MANVDRELTANTSAGAITLITSVPFFDLRRQYDSIADEVHAELRDVCERSAFILGEKVTSFESNFAQYTDTKHCVAVNSGTSALHLALRCLDIGPGDEVITVPMTFIATAWGICYAGASPVFVDVDPASRTMDPAKLKAAITARTKAIIPVHLYGLPANMSEILRVADSHGIPVIEDAAQAHGAVCDGKRIGGIGRVGCFSFYPGKNLGAYGEGGALVTNDESIAARARALRDHGQSQRYHHDEVGYNYRMDGFQGAVLGVKLRRLTHWSDRRRAIAARYNEHFASPARDGLIEIPTEAAGTRGVYHLYVILMDNRDAFRDKLQSLGVSTALHYPVPVHLQKAMAAAEHRRGAFPVSERIADRCISLPMFPEMTDEEVEFVAAKVRQALLDGR